MENTCLICVEDFDNLIHKQITCPYCSVEACSKCCQQFILEKEQSICMNPEKNENNELKCNKQWPRKFMIDNFPKKWLENQWRKMNEKVKFEREKALLPATVPALEMKRKTDEKTTEIRNIEQQLRELNRKKIELVREMHEIKFNNNNTQADRSYRGRPCGDENCRGYVSSQWKCGVCYMWTCPDCHVLKGLHRDTHHVCNPDDVATANLLNKDTNPCPSCSTPIYKIMGCDQMWCTQCHTGFSWKTGMIQTRIHNPHFFEWQRENANGSAPRTLGDVECGRDLADSRALLSIRKLLRTSGKGLESIEKKIERVVRLTIHLNHSQAPRFRVDRIVNNQDLRIQYLAKEISKKHFKSCIMRRDKAYEKKQDISDVIQLQVQTITDIIYRLENELKNIDRTTPIIGGSDINQRTIAVCDNYMVEINNATIYCNKLFVQHSQTYNCKVYKFDYNLDGNIQRVDLLF